MQIKGFILHSRKEFVIENFGIDRWDEVVKAVRNLVEVWAADARKYERMGEWIERIGWPRFFKMAGIEFQKEHIDDFKHAGLTFKRSTHFSM